MEHPKRVTELVLRGIFLLRDEELKWMYQGRGANFIFPEDWADYVAAIPQAERGDFMKAYHRRLRGELGEEGKELLLFYPVFCDVCFDLLWLECACSYLFIFFQRCTRQQRRGQCGKGASLSLFRTLLQI